MADPIDHPFVDAPGIEPDEQYGDDMCGRQLCFEIRDNHPKEQPTMKSKMYPPILVQRLETVATIEWDARGDVPMVVAAFTAAGRELDNLASRGDLTSGDALQFTFEGWTFHASSVAPQEQPIAD